MAVRSLLEHVGADVEGKMIRVNGKPVKGERTYLFKWKLRRLVRRVR